MGGLGAGAGAGVTELANIGAAANGADISEGRYSRAGAGVTGLSNQRAPISRIRRPRPSSCGAAANNGPHAVISDH